MTPQANTKDTELILLLGRLDGKMDTVLANQTDHDTRIRDLEKNRWFNLGISAAVSGAMSFAIALMGVLPR
ncbi:MAG: hypothetical protein INH37_13600 [Myxococcaceae bacterium]|nr:hypothetical protein [Myxococcaceae bacterium]